MIETAPIIEPKLVNPDGEISALVGSEFGLLFIKSVELTPDQQAELRHQLGHLAFAAVFSEQATEQALAQEGLPVFVDLRDGIKSRNEEYWESIAARRYPAWKNADLAATKLFLAAYHDYQMPDPKQMPLDLLSRLSSRALLAASELVMANHMHRAPNEDDYVGFDPSIWPYRLFCVNAVQSFTTDFYYGRGPGRSEGQELTWGMYDRLLPRQWDDDDALIFNLADVRAGVRGRFGGGESRINEEL